MWFMFWSLFMLCITFINLHMLIFHWISGIKLLNHGNWFFWYVLDFCFLFCWGYFFLIHQGDWVLIFIFCVFILLWYQGNVSFIEWFWQCSFTFSFMEQFVKHWCSFFKGWGEFSNNPIWAWICISCLYHLELIFVSHLS